MILGVGTDITDCRRLKSSLKRYPERFLSKIMSVQELNYIMEKNNKLKVSLGKDRVFSHFCLQVAKVFAAKEAFSKALGTGFRGGLRLLDVEIVRDNLGKPSFHLQPRALELFDNLIPIGMEGHVHLSLSDEYPYAQAFVTLSAD